MVRFDHQLHLPIPFLSEINFKPSASILAGKLVCIAHEYEPTASGKSRVGPALAVARMIYPSEAVKMGKKGKALTLLHAWKDQLWVKGGEVRPPRPQILKAGTNEVDDVDEEWTDEDDESDGGMWSEGSSQGGPKELSPEGAYPKRGYW